MPKVKDKPTTKRSLVRNQLSESLGREDVKLCYKVDPKDSTVKRCVFCGKNFKTSGNTSNEKGHILSMHAELVAAHVDSLKRTANNRPRETQSETQTSQADVSRKRKSTEEAPSVAPTSSAAEDEDSVDMIDVLDEPPQSKKKVTDYFQITPPDITGSDEPVAGLSKKRQMTLSEAVKNAEFSPSNTASTKLDMVRFLCTIGIPCGFVTQESLSCWNNAAIRSLSPKLLVSTMKEKAQALRPIVVESIKAAPAWSIDAQMCSFSKGFSVVTPFIYYYDQNLKQMCNTAPFSLNVDANISAERLSKLLKERFDTSGLDLQKLLGSLIHTDVVAAAIKIISPSAKSIDCAAILVEQYFISFWDQSSVKSLIGKVKSLQKVLLTQGPRKVFYAEGKKEKLVQCCFNFLLHQDNEKCLEEFMTCQKVITSVLANPVLQGHVINVDFSDFGIVKELLKILTVLKATKAKITTGNDFLLASQTIPYLHIMSQLLKNLKLKTKEGKEVQAILLKHFEMWKRAKGDRDPYVLSQMLDPRYKMICIGEKFQPLIAVNAMSTLKRKLQLLVEEKEKDEQTTAEPPPTAASVDDPDDPGSNENSDGEEEGPVVFDMRAFSNEIVASTNGAVSRAHVEETHLMAYIKDPSVEGESLDPIKFWTDRAPAEPYLSELALTHLSIPGKRWTKLSNLLHSPKISDFSTDIEDSIFCATVPEKYWKM